MFAITEGTRRVYGKEITTYTREIYSANVLEVEAGTNGFQGGDSGHGSRTYIRIEDMGSTETWATSFPFPLSCRKPLMTIAARTTGSVTSWLKSARLVTV